MKRYWVSWVIVGTLNFGSSFETIRGPMNEVEFESLQERLRKKHGKKLSILSFSKFEGEYLPTIDIKSPQRGRSS